MIEAELQPEICGGRYCEVGVIWVNYEGLLVSL